MRLENGDVLLLWPLEKHLLTAGMYYRGNNGKYTQWHGAIDLRCTWGGKTAQPVYAAEDGTVDMVQTWDGRTLTGNMSYGTMVRIKHADYRGGCLQTRYAHLSDTTVRVGTTVKAGDLIGYTGNTGNSSGAHLHFEVIWKSARRNPLVWLDADFEAASGFAPYTYGPGEQAVERPGKNAPVPVYDVTVLAASRGDADRVATLAEQLGLKYNMVGV